MSRVSWSKTSHQFLLNDIYLGEYAKRYGPPAITLDEHPFASLVESVAGQQLSGKVATVIIKRLRDLVGDVTPCNLIRFDVPALRSVGLSNAKAETLLRLSERGQKDLDFGKLKDLDDEEIIERLTTIKGIGRWTVEMFLMFHLARPDVMSAHDLGLRKGLAIVYGLGDLPKPRECVEFFERWRPYRSAASWYLWRLQDAPQ
jgi:DNA-3-methyladenine glycosylase II